MNEYHSELHNLIKRLTVCFVLYFTLTSVCLAGNPTTINESADLQITLSMIKVSGDNQYGLIGNALNEPFVVKAKDKNGNGVAGASITFSIDNQPSGATGTVLSTYNAITDSNGIAETILTFGDIVGTYAVSAAATDSEVAECSGVIETFIANADWIVIKKIYSDQFEDTVFNYLPNGAGLSGSHPQIKRIIMGAREDSKAYAKAEIEIPFNVSSIINKIVVRLAIKENGAFTIVGEGTIDGNIASMSTVLEDLDAVPDDYIVVAWIDNNENLTFDDGESYINSDGHFTIVSQGQYVEHHGYLVNRTNLADLFTRVFPLLNVPRAIAYARAFLLNEPIDIGGEYYPSFISFNAIESELQSSLNYKVGVDFSDPNVGIIKNFFFGANSELANDIRSSDEFKNIIINILDDKRNKVLAEYQSNFLFEFEMPKSIEYAGAREGEEIGEIDNDLHFVFNTASLNASLQISVTCTNSKVMLDSLEISGSLTDLYDFDYAPNPLSDGHRMALIQAGYGTLGVAGRVFRTEVKLDAILQDFIYSFGDCQ